jgi:superfamily II DNA or RNA helicase
MKEDAIFTDIAYEVSVRELIDQGYLSPLISKRMATQIDLTGVGTRGGEFIAKDLEAAVDKDSITQAAVRRNLLLRQRPKKLAHLLRRCGPCLPCS